MWRTQLSTFYVMNNKFSQIKITYLILILVLLYQFGRYSIYKQI